MATAIHSYRPVPHRLQIVAEVDGVRYIDDSIATSPARTRVALEVEGRHPELESLLVSYVQIGSAQGVDASPALIRAMERQALEVTGPLDFRDF